MEDAIKKATDEITGGLSLSEDESVLTKCAVSIAALALTSLRGDLLDRALNIAKAISEYESELILARTN